MTRPLATRRPARSRGWRSRCSRRRRFGLSGALARGLLDAGWTPGRRGAGPHRDRGRWSWRRSALVALRGRWHLMRRHWRTVAGLRPGRGGGHPVLLLLGRRAHGGGPGAADRVHRAGRHRGLAVAASRRAPRPADPRRRRRRGPGPGAGARPPVRGRPEPGRRAVGAGRDGRLRDVLRDVGRRGQRPAADRPGCRRHGRRRRSRWRRSALVGLLEMAPATASVELAGHQRRLVGARSCCSAW